MIDCLKIMRRYETYQVLKMFSTCPIPTHKFEETWSVWIWCGPNRYRRKLDTRIELDSTCHHTYRTSKDLHELFLQVEDYTVFVTLDLLYSGYKTNTSSIAKLLPKSLFSRFGRLATGSRWAQSVPCVCAIPSNECGKHHVPSESPFRVRNLNNTVNWSVHVSLVIFYLSQRNVLYYER